MTVRTIEKRYPDTHPGRYDHVSRPPSRTEELTDMARTVVLRQMGVPTQDARILYAMGNNELDP